MSGRSLGPVDRMEVFALDAAGERGPTHRVSFVDPVTGNQGSSLLLPYKVFTALYHVLPDPPNYELIVLENTLGVDVTIGTPADTSVQYSVPAAVFVLSKFWGTAIALSYTDLKAINVAIDWENTANIKVRMYNIVTASAALVDHAVEFRVYP